uniref:Uncharacterized protein n=1 Tax=Triticum urartu TaxID=4572 RepID=A0A8R7QTH6_TRIUA
MAQMNRGSLDSANPTLRSWSLRWHRCQASDCSLILDRSTEQVSTSTVSVST